jgi:hypothetical protein
MIRYRYDHSDIDMKFHIDWHPCPLRLLISQVSSLTFQLRQLGHAIESAHVRSSVMQRTTLCRVSATAYSAYLQLTSICESILLNSLSEACGRIDNFIRCSRSGICTAVWFHQNMLVHAINVELWGNQTLRERICVTFDSFVAVVLLALTPCGLVGRYQRFGGT